MPLFEPPNVESLGADADIRGLIQEMREAETYQQARDVLIELGESAIQPLVDALRVRRDDFAASEVLREIGPGAIAALVKALEKKRGSGYAAALLEDFGEHAEEVISALDGMLDEKKVFAKSWAISSLCIYARLYPQARDRIVDRIAPLRNDKSSAIRTRVRNAMVVLTTEKAPFPKGWVKAKGLKYLEEG